MRSVRCDVCGTKALMAASKCPKCGHGIEVRDGFGELLPLAHCSTCDSYYPESLGSCKWCGTKPDRAASIGPYIWKGFGILTFASLAIGAWLVHNDTPAASKKPARTFVADTLPTNQPKTETIGVRRTLASRDSIGAAPSADSVSTNVLADSAREALAVTPAETSLAPTTTVVRARTERVALQSAGTVAPGEPTAAAVESTPVDSPNAPPSSAPLASAATSRARPPERDLSRPSNHSANRTAVAKSPSRVLARAPERKPTRSAAAAAAPSRVAAKTTPPPRVASPSKSMARAKTNGRWVTTVARGWAVVRAEPTRQSRIIASIGPNTRVQLGETKGTWQRVKAKGLAGWIEHGLLGAVPAGKRTSRLASR